MQANEVSAGVHIQFSLPTPMALPLPEGPLIVQSGFLVSMRDCSRRKPEPLPRRIPFLNLSQ